MNVSFRNDKGFSLVELMVVVAIIGILAAIAVHNFQRFTAKSKQGEAKANLAAIYSAERAFQAEWQTYTSYFNVIGYRPSGVLRYEHGFGAAWPAAAPAGYAGPPFAGSFNASGFCGFGGVPGANGCVVANTPIAPAAVAIAAPATPTTLFTAEARAHIGNANAATFDVWQINQNKQITNTVDGLP